MARFGINSRNDPIPGHAPHDPEPVVVAYLDVLTGDDREEIRSVASRAVEAFAVEHFQHRAGIAN